MMYEIQRVVIVGGTHGNELTGVYLWRKFQKYPDLIRRSRFEVTTLLANPKAVEVNRRYIDKDLNRCFTNQDLANPTLINHYEERRAKEIQLYLTVTDMVIDIHSTTSNMGITILPSSRHPFNLQLAAYLSTIDPAVYVCLGQHYGEDASTLRSLCPLGLTLEVGPVAQGVLDAERFQQAERMIQAILDYTEAYMYGEYIPIPTDLILYQAFDSIDYPRDSDGELLAAIHPQLQFKDYAPLATGEPMFLTLTGTAIAYEGESTVFPIFINEAAYYEKHIAMILTNKQQIQIEPIP